MSLRYPLTLASGILLGLIAQSSLATQMHDAGIHSGEPLLLSLDAANEFVQCRDGDPWSRESFMAYPAQRIAQSPAPDGNCTYTCVPPPLTVDGRNQCGYVCTGDSTSQ